MTGCPRNYVHVSFRCQEFPHPHEFGAGQSEAAEIASRPAFHDQNATAIWNSRPASQASLPHPAWRHPPNLACILPDRPIAGELPRSRNIVNGHARPLALIAISFTKLFVGEKIGLQIGEVHETVA